MAAGFDAADLQAPWPDGSPKTVSTAGLGRFVTRSRQQKGDLTGECATAGDPLSLVIPIHKLDGRRRRADSARRGKAIL